MTSLGVALHGVDFRSALIFLGLLRDFSRADMEGAERCNVSLGNFSLFE